MVTTPQLPPRLSELRRTLEVSAQEAKELRDKLEERDEAARAAERKVTNLEATIAGKYFIS
jgi:hypothetical protein